jgi:membrane-associated phospholipid phosphatase
MWFDRRMRPTPETTIVRVAAKPSTESYLLKSERSRYLHRCLMLAAVFLVSAGLALPMDMVLARWCGQIDLPGDLAKLINYSEVFGHGLGVGLIILVATTLDCRGWRIGSYLATHAFGAGLLANLAKQLVARTRPYAVVDLTQHVKETFPGIFPLAQLWNNFSFDFGNSALASFPSAHSATATGLAAALSVCYPRGRWWFVFFAILAGSQRAFARAHFASDILAGSALAMLVVYGLEKFWGRGNAEI